MRGQARGISSAVLRAALMGLRGSAMDNLEGIRMPDHDLSSIAVRAMIEARMDKLMLSEATFGRSVEGGHSQGCPGRSMSH
jgi:hypothetical protein